MIKQKTPLAIAALSAAVVASLSFAIAQPAVEQATTGVPIASDSVETDNAARHYFLEMSADAAAVQFAERSARYGAEMRAVGRGTAEENTKAATERAAAEAIQQAWSNETAQRALLDRLSSPELNVAVVYRAQSALNGIAVTARPDQVAELAKLPGVVSVTEIPLQEPDAVSSIDFIGAKTFWNDNGLNLQGENIGVGVIDTGIDFVHTGNGGPGGTNYAAGATTTNGGTPATTFPTSKVVWGYDFAGDAYTGTGGGATPARDPNPMDTNGHGTGCATLIAGFGVNGDGTTYTGPYNSSAPAIAPLRIGPGFAPQAKLYAFRIFGTSGSTGLSGQAVDVATAVRLWQLSPEGSPYPPALANLSPAPVQVPRTPVLSVMNMSLGSPNTIFSDPNTVAVQNAFAAGLSMVNSAGNSYDTYYIVGGGSVATGAISTAASYNAQLPGFNATAPANPGGAMQPPLNLAAPVSGAANFYTGPIDLPLTDARYANPPLGNFQHLGTPPGGGTNAQQQSVALLNDANQPVSDASGNPIPGVDNPYIGKVVLIDRGDIGFHNKAIAAQRAQAAACVIINNRPGGLPGMAAAPQLFPNVTIPVIGMLQEYGAQLTNTGAPNTPPARPGLKIAFLPQNPATADEVIGYSSRGPRRTDNRLKPDITAPGENVVVNSATTGNDLRSFNGTSSAAPHVAGSMVLLRQLTNSGGTSPAWSAEELKALIMNSATGNPLVGGVNGTVRYGMSRIGAGRLTLNGGNTASVVALSTDAGGPVSVSFGQLDGPATGTTFFDKQFKVVDKFPAPPGSPYFRTFNVSYNAVNAPPGVSFSFPDGNTISVPAGGSATARVRITLNGPAMRHARDLSVSAQQVFTVGPPAALLARTFPSSEAGGHIILTESGGDDTMRLPVYAIARPHADLAVTPTTLNLPSTSAVETFTFNGTGINTGNAVDTVANAVADIKSYAKTFELSYERGSAQTNPQLKSAEITHVGVTSDFARRNTPFDPATTNNQSAVMVFSVATAADFNTPGTNGTTSGVPDIHVLIDRTGDFVEDITLRSFAWNDPTYGDGLQGSNMYLTVTNPTGSGTITTTGYFTNILLGQPTNTMNNNVVMLPVNVQRLGLTAANSRINYKVRSTFYFGTYTNETPWLTYDVARPGIDTSGPMANEPFLNVGQPGASVNANINTANARDNRALGLMMVSMWNAPGDRVQTVRAPAQLAQVISRLPHGNPGVQRDLAFSVGGNAVESRRGVNWNGTTGDYTVIFRFSSAITQGTATKTSGTGTIASQSITGGELVVNLTGVTNAQQLQFTLNGVTDELGNSFAPLQAAIGFLIGDVNADRTVNAGDVTAVRSNSGANTGVTNAASDINRDGVINSGDATIAKSASGTGF